MPGGRAAGTESHSRSGRDVTLFTGRASGEPRCRTDRNELEHSFHESSHQIDVVERQFADPRQVQPIRARAAIFSQSETDHHEAFGFRTPQGSEIALFHVLGRLPEPDFTHRVC